MRAKMSPQAIKAKMSVLEELLNMSKDQDGEDLETQFNGLKKVTVASNDSDGLEEGLEKAKDLVEDMPEDEISGHDMSKMKPGEKMSDSLYEDMKEMKPEEELSLPKSKDSDILEEDEDMKKMNMKNMPSKKKKGYLSDLV